MHDIPEVAEENQMGPGHYVFARVHGPVRPVQRVLLRKIERLTVCVEPCSRLLVHDGPRADVFYSS